MQNNSKQQWFCYKKKENNDYVVQLKRLFIIEIKCMIIVKTSFMRSNIKHSFSEIKKVCFNWKKEERKLYFIFCSRVPKSAQIVLIFWFCYIFEHVSRKLFSYRLTFTINRGMCFKFARIFLCLHFLFLEKVYWKSCSIMQ